MRMSIGTAVCSGSAPICKEGNGSRGKIKMRFDIAYADITSLLARQSLVPMGACIDFNENDLRLDTDEMAKLRCPMSGRLILTFAFASVAMGRSLGNEAKIFVANSEEMAVEHMRELHMHIGHGEKRTMVEMMRKTDRKFDEKVLDHVLARCGRLKLRPEISNIIANSHLSPYPGYALFLDIVYLRDGTAHRYPFLTVIDSFARFII